MTPEKQSEIINKLSMKAKPHDYTCAELVADYLFEIGFFQKIGLEKAPLTDGFLCSFSIKRNSLDLKIEDGDILLFLDKSPGIHAGIAVHNGKSVFHYRKETGAVVQSLYLLMQLYRLSIHEVFRP